MEGYGIWIVEFWSVIDGPGLWVLCVGVFAHLERIYERLGSQRVSLPSRIY
jgi:hypothetical protein